MLINPPKHCINNFILTSGTRILCRYSLVLSSLKWPNTIHSDVSRTLGWKVSEEGEKPSHSGPFFVVVWLSEYIGMGGSKTLF